MHYRIAKKKTTQMLSGGVCVTVGVLLQLIGCWISAALVGKGIVSEESMSVTSVLIQGLSVAVVVLIGWFLEPDQKVMLTAVSVAAVFLLQIITGLLFWHMDWSSVLMNFLVAVIVFTAIIFFLYRLKRGGGVMKSKMRYR